MFRYLFVVVLLAACWSGARSATPAARSGVFSMITIPAGWYSVGCATRPLCAENPTRRVEVKEFRIDRTKVLEFEYQRCVAAGVCRSPTRHSQWSEADDIPDPLEIAMVDVDGARAFCSWRGGHLPSAVEWEVAGRGTSARLYPWGNSWTVADLPRMGGRHFADIHEPYPRAGTRPDLRSEFGVEDMSGNAPEFVLSETQVQLRGQCVDGPPRPEDYSLVKFHTPIAYQRATFRCAFSVDH
jgi:formylglycine-generating enzyme required for sulfatase activity